MTSIFISNFIDITVQVLMILVIARAIISWIPNAHGQISDLIVKLTDPLLNPIRSVIPVVGGVDFSPLVLFFLIQVARELLNNFFRI